MDPTYGNLQRAIWSNPRELKRFRQLVVNMILATDIFDKDMMAMREQRWEKAFHQYNNVDGGTADEEYKNESSMSLAASGLNKVIDLKATVVIEHLIQASGKCSLRLVVHLGHPTVPIMGFSYNTILNFLFC